MTYYRVDVELYASPLFKSKIHRQRGFHMDFDTEEEARLWVKGQYKGKRRKKFRNWDDRLEKYEDRGYSYYFRLKLSDGTFNCSADVVIRKIQEEYIL